VLTGSSPARLIRAAVANAGASPRPQKPAASSQYHTDGLKPSYSWAALISPGPSPHSRHSAAASGWPVAMWSPSA
jgi:hypothetical protein